MFCRKCGKEIPDDSLFCPKCGTGTATDETPDDIIGEQPVQETTEFSEIKNSNENPKTGSNTAVRKFAPGKVRRIVIWLVIIVVAVCIVVSEIVVRIPQKGVELFHDYFGVSISTPDYNYLVNNKASVLGYIAYGLGGGQDGLLHKIARDTGVRISIKSVERFKEALPEIYYDHNTSSVIPS